MKPIENLSSKLGITRSDVIIAFSLSAIGIIGFVFSLFSNDNVDVQTKDMLKLAIRYDSIINANTDKNIENVINKQFKSDTIFSNSNDTNSLNNTKTNSELTLFIPSSNIENSSNINDYKHNESYKKDLPKVKIDINNDPIDDLIKLPGVGQSIAEKIIEYRKLNKFSSTTDLLNVSGIGDKKYNKMKNFIKVK
ncbi:MAG: helix-hairpin-helix domain-containing protein [Chlorobi bacterium]|nr:helix-hairpin-helix domain-containing protein [Chlorobiota bacterium]